MHFYDVRVLEIVSQHIPDRNTVIEAMTNNKLKHHTSHVDDIRDKYRCLPAGHSVNVSEYQDAPVLPVLHGEPSKLELRENHLEPLLQVLCLHEKTSFS